MRSRSLFEKMKKLFYIFVVQLFVCKIAFAFSPFGLKSIFVGPNYSNLRNSDGQYKLGIAIGFQGEAFLNKKSSFSWGIFYKTQGGILKDYFIHPINSLGLQQGPNFISDIHVLVSFLELPVHLNFLLLLNKSSRLSIYSGPQISYALNDFTELKNKRVLPDYEQDISYPIYNQYTYEASPYADYLDKGIKLGYSFGMALHYRDFAIDLRYSYLKQKLNSIDKIRSLYKKIYAFQFLLGYHF